MKVVRNPTPDDTSRAAPGAHAVTPAPQLPTQSATPALPESGAAETRKANAPSASVAAETAPANVTFRRDEQGHIYYVLTDPQSGKEIREVPSAEIRKVGKGIADYLKQEATKVFHA